MPDSSPHSVQEVREQAEWLMSDQNLYGVSADEELLCQMALDLIEQLEAAREEILFLCSDEDDIRKGLREQLEAVRTWFATEPWKGHPDPSSFGGSPDYTPAERALGYGSYRDDRFLPEILRGVSTPARES